MNAPLLRLSAIALFGLVAFATAQAQVADHLECYKIKDPLKLQAFVDLDSPQFGLAANCKVGKAKFFCAPAEKTVISAVDKETKLPITPLPVTGPNAGDRICYKVKCAEPFPPDTQATDQFGTRTFGKFKTQLLCTPSVKGTAFCGNGSIDAGEQCDGVNLGAGCGGGCLADCRCRFKDNGDGTVADNQTGLQWEKKDSAGGGSSVCPGGATCDNPHDVDNTYTWGNFAGCPFTGCPNGTAFTDFLGRLNDCTSSDSTAVTNAGFAGHCDWRLPTIQELKTIIDRGASGCGSGSACIDPIFGPWPQGFGRYWSATTYPGFPNNAWVAGFSVGNWFLDGKGYNSTVRAVRAGS